MEKELYKDCVRAKMCFVCENNLSNSGEEPCQSCLIAWHINKKDVPGFKKMANLEKEEQP